MFLTETLMNNKKLIETTMKMRTKKKHKSTGVHTAKVIGVAHKLTLKLNKKKKKNRLWQQNRGRRI